MIKQIFAASLLCILAACASAEAAPTLVSATPTLHSPTSTSILPTRIPTLTPTVQASCDPLQEDFCITDGHFILERPIHRPDNDRVEATYRYGSTANGERAPHHGVEFNNASGTAVYAAAPGTVIFAGPDETAIYSPWQNFYGNMVVVAHDDDLFTLYNHLSSIGVQAGQRVTAGQKIGEVGTTGASIGSHLHFEVRRGNVQDYFSTCNPELWLAPVRIDGKDSGVIVLRVADQDGRLVRDANYTIRQHVDPSKPHVKSYYGSTYAAELLRGEENAALGDLPPGHYRIAVDINGKVYERWVEVESGRLTEVVFVVK